MNRAQSRFAWRGVLSGCLIALLLSRVNWMELAAVLQGARPVPLALGFTLIGCGPFLMAARTRLLLVQWGIQLTYPPVLALTWAGQFCNAFLPGSTGGDAIKFWRVCRLAPDHKTAGFAALVADRLAALLGLILLASAALFGGSHDLLREIVLAGSARIGVRLCLAVLGLSAFALWMAFLLWRQYLARHWVAKARAMAAALRRGLYPSPAIGTALLLALIVHCVSMTSFYQFCHALQIPASFHQVMLIWPVTTLAVLLPLTVNGHGLREFILLFYFQHWHLRSALAGENAPTETVLALSLLIVATDFFWSLPGGIGLARGARRAAPGQEKAGQSCAASPAPTMAGVQAFRLR
jgi:uncharacterized membrane protein YbhN (UPF0104 family)